MCRASLCVFSLVVECGCQSVPVQLIACKDSSLRNDSLRVEWNSPTYLLCIT